MPTTDPRVDAFIDNAKDFAKPILVRIRKMVHTACPDVVETIKWRMPFFEYNGQILCGMAAFKEHCSIVIWKASLIEGAPANGDSSMGSFGRITSLKELPSQAEFSRLLKTAMKLTDAGVTPSDRRRARSPKRTCRRSSARPSRRTRRRPQSSRNFPPSHCREYCEWISEAKRDETKAEAREAGSRVDRRWEGA